MIKTNLAALMLLLPLLTGCYQTQYSEPKTEQATVVSTDFTPATGGESPTPEKFSVTFYCDHDTFTIEGSGERYADLWKRMVRGQPVVITYREIYRATKKGTNFHDFDFIDARPISLGEL